jgi:hypothetical protein
MSLVLPLELRTGEGKKIVEIWDRVQIESGSTPVNSADAQQRAQRERPPGAMRPQSSP